MRHSVRSGFTLSEVLITIVILAILVGMAVPGYRRAVEQGHWRGAQDVLLIIYAGEQVHEAQENTYVNPAACPPPDAPWECVYMDNPNGGVVTYTVDTVSATTFRAVAARGDGRTMSINQTKVIDFSGWPQP